MTRLVLVRHGQAQTFLDQIVSGHESCSGLSDLGRQQAEALRARLARTGEVAEATALYASRMRRAQETALLIQPAVGSGTLELNVECGVCEQHPGVADGMAWEEYAARWPTSILDGTDRTAIGPDGSESIAMMADRVGAALLAIADRHAGEMIVIGCHGGVVNCSLETLGGVPFGSLTRYVDNTSITEWHRDDDTGRWWLVRVNDAAHLR